MIKAWLFVLILPLAGCASLVRQATAPLADSIRIGIEDQTDPEIARSGLPAYLMLLDGLIAKSPNDAALLTTGTRLYGGYAALVNEPERQQALAAKAFGYADRAACQALKALCGAPAQTLDALNARYASLGTTDLALALAYAQAWAGQIQADAGNWDQVAAVPKVSALLARIEALDPNFERGLPSLYLGVLNALLPAAYGGKPEVAKAHFEDSLKRSNRRNLMVQTLYAQFYARLTFDRKLHDALLDEVLAAPVAEPGFGLNNALAKQRAAALKDSGNDYF
jgi:hypothetical protein